MCACVSKDPKTPRSAPVASARTTRAPLPEPLHEPEPERGEPAVVALTRGASLAALDDELSEEERKVLRAYAPLRWFRAAVVYLDSTSGTPHYWRLARWAPLPRQDTAWFNSLELATAAQIRGRTGFPGLVATLQARAQDAHEVPMCFTQPPEARPNESGDSLLCGKPNVGSADIAALSPPSEDCPGHAGDLGQSDDLQDLGQLEQPGIEMPDSGIQSSCGDDSTGRPTATDDLSWQGELESSVATASGSSPRVTPSLHAEGHPGRPRELDGSSCCARPRGASASKQCPHAAETPVSNARTSSLELRLKEARRQIPIKHTFVHLPLHGAPLPRSLSF